LPVAAAEARVAEAVVVLAAYLLGLQHRTPEPVTQSPLAAAAVTMRREDHLGSVLSSLPAADVEDATSVSITPVKRLAATVALVVALA
jgi:hypothetical protein